MSSAGRQQEQGQQFGSTSGRGQAAENAFLGEIPLSGRLGQHVRPGQGEPEQQGHGPDKLRSRAVDTAVFSPPIDETNNGSGSSAAAAPEPAWRMVMQVPQSLVAVTVAAAAAAGAEAGAGAAAAPGGKGAAEWSGSSGQSPRHQRALRPLSADVPAVLPSSGEGRAA